MVVVVLVLAPKVPHTHLQLGIRGGNGDQLPLDVDSVGPLVSQILLSLFTTSSLSVSSSMVN